MVTDYSLGGDFPTRRGVSPVDNSALRFQIETFFGSLEFLCTFVVGFNFKPRCKDRNNILYTEINLIIIITFNIYDMNNRLRKFIDYLQLTTNKFEQCINVGQGSVLRATKGQNRLSTDTILKIFDSYPMLNLDWLLTGRGSMLVKNCEKGVEKGQNPPQKTTDDENFSPLVEFLTAQLREKDARIETLAAEAALLRAQLEKNPTTISASTPMETSTSK